MNILRQCLRLIVVAIFLPILSSSQWQRIPGPDGSRIPYIATDGIKLFAGIAGQGVYASTDDGLNWRLLNTEGMPAYPVGYPLAVDGDNLYCGWPSLYYSSNGGENWSRTISAAFVDAVIAFDSVAIAIGGDMLRSTDNGMTWSVAHAGVYIPVCIIVKNCIVRKRDILFAHHQCSLSGLLRSTDNGETWTNIQSFEPGSLAVSGDHIFASAGGVLESTDEGANWVKTPLPFGVLAATSDLVFSGTSRNGVYRMSIGDSTAQAVNEGLAGMAQWIFQLLPYHGYLYATAETSGIWRRPLTELVSVKNSQEPLPTAFGLEQNYPNPFNPQTTIYYELPEMSFVQLKVYDLLGREIITIVNDVRSPGRYSEHFDGSSLSSGVYVYRMIAGKFFEVRKMLLIR